MFCSNNIDSGTEVLQQRAQFGINWLSQVLVDIDNGRNFSVIAQIYRRAGMVSFPRLSSLTTAYAMMRDAARDIMEG